MIKVALIGAGRMGKVHFDAYKSIPDVKIVAAVDIEIQAAKERLNDADVVFYDDLDCMLKKEKVDMVDICTPTYLHAEHAIKAMDKGVHVICEKPISLNVDDARKIVDAAHRNNVFFMVAQVIRFWPEYEYLKKVYDEKTYGKLYQILFTRVGEMTKSSWKDWMRDISKSGMAPIDLHIHDVDFILHMFGKPNAVTSFAKQDGKNISWINTHYDYNDAIIEAEGAWYQPKYSFSMSYRASFEDAILEYKSSKLTLYKSCGETTQIHLEDVKSTSQLNVGSVNGYQYEIEYFVNCVRNNIPPKRIIPEESVMSLELVLKELESAREAKKVIV
ncbi:MAG TPA: Gfo/Idh/MocA family oxidoreductase [Clostridiales bacterium]|nr:Gfo/Idh/MocA family oxidoreductase [Clostridiales bacterium]